MTLLELGFVLLSLVVAVVGAVLGLVEFGPLGGVLGALAPVPLWLGLGWVGAILARRHQQTRLAPARLRRLRRRRRRR